MRKPSNVGPERMTGLHGRVRGGSINSEGKERCESWLSEPVRRAGISEDDWRRPDVMPPSSSGPNALRPPGRWIADSQSEWRHDSVMPEDRDCRRHRRALRRRVADGEGVLARRGIDDVAPAVGPETMILPVLNGIRHVGILTARFGDKAVVGCVCKVAANLDDRGRVVQLAPFHELAYGQLSGAPSDRTEQLDGVMQGAGFDARLSRTIDREMWEKWVLLSTLGGITCMMRGRRRDRGGRRSSLRTSVPGGNPLRRHHGRTSAERRVRGESKDSPDRKRARP